MRINTSFFLHKNYIFAEDNYTIKMKNILITTIALLTIITGANAQKVFNKRISVHDPSIFYDATSSSSDPTYYIYGSHLAAGKTSASKSYIQWTSFGGGESTSCTLFATTAGVKTTYANAYNTHAITKVKDCNGNEVTFGNFNAHDWQYTGNTVQGMQWAPDVIYNKKMKKWCMYMSLNGDNWGSSICCFTSSNPEGPWIYQGPVVFSGFQGYFAHNGFTATDDYKHTDYTIATGETTLAGRYKVGKSWGSYWPNCIDPCVFYDEDGKLWMSYGSWSGGIFILRLDEETGLRDYTVKYPYQVNGVTSTATGTASQDCSCDPYFGKKIAGGWYVSGEASYIQYFNGYYYLFMSYGGLTANGGYQIRVFRSTKPDGPYKDCSTTTGLSALYTGKYVLNFGKNAGRDEGVKLFGNYKWEKMSTAELAQGHNSAIVDHNGHMLLVYHTRFNNGTEGHQVRVHEMWQNQDGWLVASPYEYGGETVTQSDIASKELYTKEQIAGTYGFMAHPYRQDTENKAFETPVNISLNTDGSVTGAYTGTWTYENSYITIKVKGPKTNNALVEFKGVLTEQTIDYTTTKTLCFTALSSSSGVATSAGAALQTRGLSVWGTRTGAPTGGSSSGDGDDNVDPTTAVYYPVSGYNRTTDGWWSNFSREYYTLKQGGTAEFHFYNYSNKEKNWNNWVLYGTSGVRNSTGYKEYFGVRADNWDVVSNSNNGCVSAYDWDTFKEDMDGSLVDMTCNYGVGGAFVMSSTIKTQAGKTLDYSYSTTITGNPAQITLFFVSEGSYIDGEKAKTTGINILKNDALTTKKSNIYNMNGQLVDENYRGVVIKNGRKIIQK